MTPNPSGFPTVGGLHHVTAIAGDPNRSVAFYTRLLGLRLVKRTVNFDDPTAYHLYFGTETGAPGTLLTFFYWRKDRTDFQGHGGVGGVAALTLSIPRGARPCWQERLAAAGVATRAGERFGDPLLSFSDPDQIPVELVESADDRRPWNGTDVPESQAITGLHSASLMVSKPDATEAMLGAGLGLTRVASEPGRTRWSAGPARPGNFVDVCVAGADAPDAAVGIGTVHHIALRAATARRRSASGADCSRGATRSRRCATASTSSPSTSASPETRWRRSRRTARASRSTSVPRGWARASASPRRWSGSANTLSLRSRR